MLSGPRASAHPPWAPAGMIGFPRGLTDVTHAGEWGEARCDAPTLASALRAPSRSSGIPDVGDVSGDKDRHPPGALRILLLLRVAPCPSPPRAMSETRVKSHSDQAGPLAGDGN